MPSYEPLPRSFYVGGAAGVAPALLGHRLVRRTPHGLAGGPIVEVEAYLSDDPACHAFRGKTSRNSVMFGPGGRAYVYFIYGCHFCVNAVCGPEGVGEAVLIRAVEPEIGIEWIRRRRPVATERNLTSGPAKLCQALGIAGSENGADLCLLNSPIFIARNPSVDQFRGAKGPIIEGPRIGISKAADLPLRFCLAGSHYLSRSAK